MPPEHPRPRPRPTLSLLAALIAGVLLAGGAAAPASADPAPVPVGAAVWPLVPVPEVVRGFDPPDRPWGAGHRGVDLAGSPGQPVRAALGGTVTYAGRLAGRGVVVVDHGATRTTYEPVEADVAVGDTLAAGDRIGRLQTGGSHCAPATCLHWGLLEGEQYLDPLTLVGAGPVRLLPLDGMPPGSVDVTGGGRMTAEAPLARTGVPAWAQSRPDPPAAGVRLVESRGGVPPATPRGRAALFRDGRLG